MIRLTFPPCRRGRVPRGSMITPRTAPIVPALVLLSGALLPANVHAFREDFDDGNDDGWTRFDPLNGLGVAAPVQFEFPDGGFRIHAPAPAVSAAGPARGFSYRADMQLDDFYIAADIVNWNDELDQAFGLLARGGNLGAGTTTGYVCNYDPNQDGTGPGDRPGGQFQINIVTGEASERTIAAGNVKLVAGRSYRMVFMGVGGDLSAALYDLEDLTRPVVVIRTLPGDPDGERYPSGVMGLFNFYRGDDPTNPLHVADATWDNIVIEEADPRPELAPGTPASLPGSVNVTDKIPASYANFHPAGEGIRMTLTTFGDGEVNPASVTLSLNGTDVTSELVATVDGGEVTIEFDGLQPATVYQAALNAANADGEVIHHAWTFDTFDAAVLGTPEYFVIEAEDYNYESGKFLENAEPEAYLGFTGTPDIDYHDFATGSSGQYRLGDFVSTKGVLDEVDPEEVLIDTIRPPFVNAGAFDYAVNDTESGEWLNYTREFLPGEYAVYLRLASRQAQNLRLQRVTSDPTMSAQTVEEIGIFKAPTTIGTSQFVYVPLTDMQGDPAAVPLLGQTTLRLLVDGPAQNRIQRGTLFLNHLLFARDPASNARFGFRITSIERDAALGETRLRFNSVPGRFYAIEYKEKLSDAFWQELADFEAADTESAFTDGDPERFARPQGYYRVSEP